jgi:DNA-binding MarR family transcriptional regulator
MATDTEPSLAALETAGLLFRHANRLFRRLRASRAANSLGVSKLGILARLHQDGPATAKYLAAYLGLQPQSMTRLLSTMENAGLIHRHLDQTDRRQIRIELTDEGRKLLLEDVARRHDRLARSLIRVLTTAEIELLRIAAGLMERVTAAIEPPAPSAEPGGMKS